MDINLSTIATKQLHTYTAEVYNDGTLVYTMTADAESPDDFQLRYQEMLIEKFPGETLKYILIS